MKHTKNLLYLLVISSLICSLSGCNSDNKTIATPPNILILLADDAGWQDFGCYGNPYIKTPNIDFLAANGLKANNAFLTVAQCSPSRISILTGKYPHATGAEDLHMHMPDSLTILPKYLKQKDYFTGYLRKGHLGPHGESQFDWHHRELDQFANFLDSISNNPFFMWVGFTDPHRPYKENIIDSPQSPSKVIVPEYLVDDSLTRQDLAKYYNYIRRMDAQIGSYLAELRSRGKLDNTLIIFLTDNGAPFPRAKGTVYDAGIKTPFIVYWPKNITTPRETNELISVIDLAPSLLSLVGMEVPSSFQGQPVNMFSNIPFTGRSYIFSERNWHNCDEHIRSIRSDQYKLIKNAYTELPHGTAADISNSPSFQSLLTQKEVGNLTAAQAALFQVPRPEFELYDVIADPLEINNLANSEEAKEVFETLKSTLEKWIQDTNDFPANQRRRKDNTDRFTGVKFDQTRLPERI